MAVAMSAACRKSAEQKAAEQAAENTRVAAEQMKNAAESAAAAGTAAAAAGLEGFARTMSGMAGKGPDGKPVDPMSFKDLQTGLPDISGWKREEPKGERITMPVPFSQIEADYTWALHG